MRVRQLLAVVATALLAAVMLVGAGAPARADSYPPAGLRVVAGVVTPTAVHVGGSVTFTGSGFAPGALLRLSVDGVQLSQLRADTHGAFTVTLPMTALGSRALAVSGLEAGARLRVVTGQVTVIAAALGGLPHTGSDRTIPSLLLGFGLVAGGAGLVLASRARGHRRAAAGLPAA